MEVIIGPLQINVNKMSVDKFSLLCHISETFSFVVYFNVIRMS